MDNKPIECNLSKTYKQRHHFLLPSPSCRALLIGQSSCGKTNLLLRLLLKDKWLDYNRLYIYSKSLHQPEYKILTTCLNLGYSKSDVLKIFETKKGNCDQFLETLIKQNKIKISVDSFSHSDSIPDPSEIDYEKRNLFVFDDVMNVNNQSKAEDYYTRGRHNNISCFYIAQNYFKLPRQTIRSNANVLILFSLPKKDLYHIYEDFCSSDMEFCEFQNLFSNKPYEYVVINTELSPAEGKYQVNLNSVYVPKKFL